MRNITGQAVVGGDLYGRERELARLWEKLEQGEHVSILAPRRVGKTSLMLELRRAPHPGWDVVYVDLEGAAGPADCIAAVIAALAEIPRYRTGLGSFPFSNAVRDVLRRLRSVGLGALRVDLKSATGGEWDREADRLQKCLANLPGADRRLLIVVDELPVPVARLLRTAEGARDAELLLSRLRYWRQAPELRGRVLMLFGGSVGLEGVLRRARLSAPINDLSPFHLGAWDRPTAAAFLEELGRDCDFRLDEGVAARILDLLGDPVPYHVQLFFSALRDACAGDPSGVSPETVERCFAERLAGPGGTAHLDHYETRLETAFDDRDLETARAVLDRVCRRADGAAFPALEDLRQSGGPAFPSVLRDLQADGYLLREDDRLRFRSNLLRQWWRERRGAEAAR